MCWIWKWRSLHSVERVVEICNGFQALVKLGLVPFGKAIASVDGKRAVTCEIKFAVEQ